MGKVSEFSISVLAIILGVPDHAFKRFAIKSGDWRLHIDPVITNGMQTYLLPSPAIRINAALSILLVEESGSLSRNQTWRGCW